jgi:hypothetical protein
MEQVGLAVISGIVSGLVGGWIGATLGIRVGVRVQLGSGNRQRTSGSRSPIAGRDQY